MPVDELRISICVSPVAVTIYAEAEQLAVDVLAAREHRAVLEAEEAVLARDGDLDDLWPAKAPLKDVDEPRKRHKPLGGS